MRVLCPNNLLHNLVLMYFMSPELEFPIRALLELPEISELTKNVDTVKSALEQIPAIGCVRGGMFRLNDVYRKDIYGHRWGARLCMPPHLFYRDPSVAMTSERRATMGEVSKAGQSREDIYIKEGKISKSYTQGEIAFIFMSLLHSQTPKAGKHPVEIPYRLMRQPSAIKQLFVDDLPKLYLSSIQDGLGDALHYALTPYASQIEEEMGVQSMTLGDQKEFILNRVIAESAPGPYYSQDVYKENRNIYGGNAYGERRSFGEYGRKYRKKYTF